MEVREIPAGRHAIFVHKGKLDTLGDTMDFIYNSWLPASGEKQRDAPDLEIYGEKFDMNSDDSEMEICIPIEG
jgi:AraC family transcriptional regulator